MGFFLRECFPARGLEEVREEAFILLYGYKGSFTLPIIKAMKSEERSWYCNRLIEQKNAEAAEIKKASER